MAECERLLSRLREVRNLQKQVEKTGSKDRTNQSNFSTNNHPRVTPSNKQSGTNSHANLDLSSGSPVSPPASPSSFNTNEILVTPHRMVNGTTPSNKKNENKSNGNSANVNASSAIDADLTSIDALFIPTHRSLINNSTFAQERELYKAFGVTPTSSKVNKNVKNDSFNPPARKRGQSAVPGASPNRRASRKRRSTSVGPQSTIVAVNNLEDNHLHLNSLFDPTFQATAAVTTIDQCEIALPNADILSSSKGKEDNNSAQGLSTTSHMIPGQPPPPLEPRATSSRPLNSDQVLSNPQLTELRFRKPEVGMRNTNNTCFISSVLQALYHTDKFVKDLFSFEIKPPDPSKASKMDLEDHEIGEALLRNLQYLFAMLLVTKRPHLDIADFLNELPKSYFPEGEQMDCTEVLSFILDKLGGTNQSLVRGCFAGELNYVTKCGNCTFEQRKGETFVETILPVPSAEDPNLSVQKLFENFLTSESLSDSKNLWQCPKCNVKSKSTNKYSEIVSPPQHLCLRLGRLDMDFTTMTLNKKKTYVHLNPTIVLPPNWVFDLYCVVIHEGKSGSEGHYTLCVRRSESESENVNDESVSGFENNNNLKWWRFDDSQVKTCDSEYLVNLGKGKYIDNSPYLLLYRCRQAGFTSAPVLPGSFIKEVIDADEVEIQNTS